MDLKGGYGRCSYCKNYISNVSFHEAWECLSRPNIGLNPIAEPKIIEVTGLEIHCNACRKPITQPAAILFSPPIDIQYEKMTVKKFHICHECYGKIYDHLLLEPNSYDPQRRVEE